MRVLSLFAWLFTGLLLWLASSVAQADVSKTDQELIKTVSQGLLAVAETHPDKLAWPPRFEIIQDLGAFGLEEGGVNAFAGLTRGDAGEVIPVIFVTPGLMEKVVQGKEDRLALILGHELAHHILGHTLSQTPGETRLVELVFSRQEEFAADRLGMRLALAAGSSYRGARDVWRRMRDLGFDYSSFEGFLAGHPSWVDRLAIIDKERAPLWKAMSAFQNGSLFLALEQYAAAERCFRAVTREFRDCHEAWANLGYALLMQYCDALETEDLRRFGIGHMVAGGFYRRPGSLEVKVRGINTELWDEAVEALTKALEIEPDLALVRANVGLAYLVHPAVKVEQATKYFREAAAAVQKDTALDPLTRAVVFINAAVAEAAAGRFEQGAERLNQAQEQIARRSASDRRDLLTGSAVSAALLHNRALLRSRSGRREDRREAVSRFEEYLRSASPASMWRIVAREQYTKLCEELGLEAKPDGKLLSQRTAEWRLVTSVELGSGATVALTELIGEVRDRLGPAQEVVVVKGVEKRGVDTSLKRLRYPNHGIELLCTDRVLGICFCEPSAPSLVLRRAGLGAHAVKLHVGMKKQELDQIMENDDYDYRELGDPEVHYRFYADIGLAVRVRRGRIENLVVAQIPRREVFGTN